MQAVSVRGPTVWLRPPRPSEGWSDASGSERTVASALMLPLTTLAASDGGGRGLRVGELSDRPLLLEERLTGDRAASKESEGFRTLARVGKSLSNANCDWPSCGESTGGKTGGVGGTEEKRCKGLS